MECDSFYRLFRGLKLLDKFLIVLLPGCLELREAAVGEVAASVKKSRPEVSVEELLKRRKLEEPSGMSFWQNNRVSMLADQLRSGGDITTLIVQHHFWR